MESQDQHAVINHAESAKSSLFSRFKKRKKLVIVLLLIILAWLGLYVVTLFVDNPERDGEPNNTPISSFSPAPQTSDSVESGAALVEKPNTRAELEARYGNPTDTEAYLGEQFYYYDSTVPSEKHEAVYGKNEEVVFFKRVIDVNSNISVLDIYQLYGDKPFILYGPGSNSGIYLHVYPEQGFAFYGTFSGDYILEVWYFPPVNTLEMFIEKWAPDFSLDRENVKIE